MNNRTEKKLKDTSGMERAIKNLLQQAWGRGYKYGLQNGGLRHESVRYGFHGIFCISVHQVRH